VHRFGSYHPFVQIVVPQGRQVRVWAHFLKADSQYSEAVVVEKTWLLIKRTGTISSL
jgi:hypothetical protein